MEKIKRINDTIKNNYLVTTYIDAFKQLLLEVERSVFFYNNNKPHIEFQRKSPIQFENDYFCKAKSKLYQTDGSEEPNNK